MTRPMWAQAPADRPSASPLLPLAAWALGAVPLLVQLDRLDHFPEAIRRAGGILLIAALVAPRRPRRPLWAAMVALVTAAVLPIDRSVPLVAHELGVALVALWSLEIGAVRWRPVTTAGRCLAAPPLVAATALLLVRQGVQLPAATTAAAAVALAIGARPAWFERPAAALAPITSRARSLVTANGRLLDRIGRPIGAVFGAVAMAPAALLVAPAWAAHRIAGSDVLAAPTSAGGRWVRRAGADPEWDRQFDGVTTIDRRPDAGRRALAAVLSTAMVAAIAAGGTAAVLTATRDDAGTYDGPGAGATSAAAARGAQVDECRDRDEPATASLARQPGARDMVCELRAFVSSPRFVASTIFDYPDFSGRWVHQRDGERRTWRPPACDCRRLRVWWFGGSAAWGWNQRDEYSLPSQLARAAAARGITLDIENRAMPAWVLGQEVRRFETLLRSGAERPDLVVFYDGGNELNRQKERDGRGVGADESSTSFLESEIGDHLWYGTADRDTAGIAPPRLPGPRLTPEAIAHHALARYERDVDLARRIGRANGLDPVFVWQPLRHTSSAAAATRDAFDPKDDRLWRRMAPAAAAALPAGVLDLSTALAGVDHPVFEDFYHHNEEAAAIVADDLLGRLAPRLDDLEARR